MHEATPFLPQDANYRSVGAVKVSAASPKQLGFFGFFLPSEYLDKDAGPSSFFPDLKNPALALGVYEGELYPQGRPQSVYTLSTEKMTQLKNAKGEPLRLLLKPGQTHTAARWPGEHHLRLGPALGGALGPLRPGQGPGAGRRRRRAGRADRLADDPPSPGVRARPTRAGVVRWSPSAAWPRVRTPGLGATIEDLLRTIAERTGTTV